MKYASMAFRFAVLWVLTQFAADGLVARFGVHIITALVTTAVMWLAAWAASGIEARQ